jgi:hypothetical protein
VTYGEAFAVQPFGNSLVTMTVTGAQIDTLLEQQFDNPGVGQNRILQVSEGFAYSWSAAAPKGSKVDPASITLNGVPIDPAASYRITVNNFMADGGDGYLVLREGTNRLGGDVDLDALEKYFTAQGVVAPARRTASRGCRSSRPGGGARAPPPGPPARSNAVRPPPLLDVNAAYERPHTMHGLSRRGAGLVAGSLAAGLVLVPLAATPAAAVPGSESAVFVNEFHYDNAGTDTGEFIELAGPAGTDLSGWSIVRYNGSTPTAAVVYPVNSATALSGVIAGSPGGYGLVVVDFPVDGLQNGGNDGFALVNGGSVVQLLSYEGAFTASNGPAAA